MIKQQSDINRDLKYFVKINIVIKQSGWYRYSKIYERNIQNSIYPKFT